MDSSSDRAPDPLAAWLAATEGSAAAGPPPTETENPASGAGRRPSRRLLVIAAVPWLVVIAVGATAVGRSVPASSAPGRPAATERPAVAGTAAPSFTVDPASAQPALDSRLAAAAIVTVRLASPDDQYLDTLVAEQVDTVAGAAVVTVAAAVLDRVDGQWVGPRHVRFAIPFSVDRSEPVALAEPWVLPATQRPLARPHATPVDDTALADAAMDSLAAAGYRDIAAAQLRRHAALPDILAVHVSARAPGDRIARDHQIWLDAAASRVLGGPAPAPAPLPAPVPAETP